MAAVGAFDEPLLMLDTIGDFEQNQGQGAFYGVQMLEIIFHSYDPEIDMLHIHHVAIELAAS